MISIITINYNNATGLLKTLNSIDNQICTNKFEHIIIDGAMMYMMTFRSNEQSAAIHRDKFSEGIKMMRRLLLDDPLSVSSTVIVNNRTTFSRVV